MSYPSSQLKAQYARRASKTKLKRESGLLTETYLSTIPPIAEHNWTLLSPPHPPYSPHILPLSYSYNNIVLSSYYRLTIILLLFLRHIRFAVESFPSVFW